MAELDDFIRSQVTPQLRPGETIAELGQLNRYFSKKKTIDQVFVGAVTNQRVILIATELNKWKGVPKLENQGVTIHELANVRSVSNRAAKFGAYGWRPFTLVFNDGSHVLYYIPPKVKNCDGQASLASMPDRWVASQQGQGARAPAQQAAHQPHSAQPAYQMQAPQGEYSQAVAAAPATTSSKSSPRTSIALVAGPAILVVGLLARSEPIFLAGAVLLGFGVLMLLKARFLD